MKDFFNKFKSRKFLTCVIGILMGVCMYFGVDVTVMDKVAGAIMSIVSIVTYIAVEGTIDAAAIKDVVDKVDEAIDAVEDVEE